VPNTGVTSKKNHSLSFSVKIKSHTSLVCWQKYLYCDTDALTVAISMLGFFYINSGTSNNNNKHPYCLDEVNEDLTL